MPLSKPLPLMLLFVLLFHLQLKTAWSQNPDTTQEKPVVILDTIKDSVPMLTDSMPQADTLPPDLSDSVAVPVAKPDSVSTQETLPDSATLPKPAILDTGSVEKPDSTHQDRVEEKGETPEPQAETTESKQAEEEKPSQQQTTPPKKGGHIVLVVLGLFFLTLLFVPGS